MTNNIGIHLRVGVEILLLRQFACIFDHGAPPIPKNILYRCFAPGRKPLSVYRPDLAYSLREIRLVYREIGGHEERIREIQQARGGTIVAHQCKPLNNIRFLRCLTNVVTGLSFEFTNKVTFPLSSILTVIYVK